MIMLTVPRLNYREIYMSLRDLGFQDKRPLDLEDASVIFTVKEHLTDDETLVKIQKDNMGGGIEICDAAKGEILLTLTPGDMSLPSSDYTADIFVIKDDRVSSSELFIFRVTPTVLGELP